MSHLYASHKLMIWVIWGLVSESGNKSLPESILSWKKVFCEPSANTRLISYHICFWIQKFIGITWSNRFTFYLTISLWNKCFQTNAIECWSNIGTCCCRSVTIVFDNRVSTLVNVNTYVTSSSESRKTFEISIYKCITICIGAFFWNSMKGYFLKKRFKWRLNLLTRDSLLQCTILSRQVMTDILATFWL